MKWVKPQSLYLQLLLFLGLPLILLWGLSAFNSYVNALQAATQAYDRTLLSSARTVSERLVVRNNHLEVNVPWVVLDSFELNMNDRLYYKVVDPSGKVISGYDDLPAMPSATPRTRLYPALAWFYHTEYRGDATIPSLSGGATAVLLLDLTGPAGVADPGAGWLVITPDPAAYASTFLINGTP